MNNANSKMIKKENSIEEQYSDFEVLNGLNAFSTGQSNANMAPKEDNEGDEWMDRVPKITRSNFREFGRDRTNTYNNEMHDVLSVSQNNVPRRDSKGRQGFHPLTNRVTNASHHADNNALNTEATGPLTDRISVQNTTAVSVPQSKRNDIMRQS